MGDFVVTSGADRALRVWQRTEEPFFVEEEKEKRLESLFEADLEVRRTLSLLRSSTRSMRQQWLCLCNMCCQHRPSLCLGRISVSAK